MDLVITILPVVTKNLPISPRFTPYNFLSRCKFSTLSYNSSTNGYRRLIHPHACAGPKPSAAAAVCLAPVYSLGAMR